MAPESYLTVVRGDPSPEELAALIVALAARAASAENAEDPQVSADAAEPARRRWRDAARRAPAPGGDAGAWRVSGWA
ncbi:hypothetical protein Skr01_52000 [Sphaerisporangium krabiense]|uniref:Acyl-CoA carboxylase subunit epsilon n=1 Tax=Sphaerisporangium krabiense TaxID=763782 RepID=A0A7W8Z9V9_9ACTN|nr:acyl-CoA carboxylase epsilon subunit [Sphaerisporangium krabiense]MBB5630164.1 hypothetical protein [Sphaerisporangium krabiense]GII65115.1 hypothetical protein Skr01_52000 [Sphaerisporangium krabiense]